MVNNRIIKKLSYLLLSLILIWLGACNNAPSTSSLVELDLMKDGLPIKILAPPNAEVVTSDMGFIKDVTVKGDDNYYVQILGGSAHITDMNVLVQDKINESKKFTFLFRDN